MFPKQKSCSPFMWLALSQMTFCLPLSLLALQASFTSCHLQIMSPIREVQASDKWQTKELDERVTPPAFSMSFPEA